jgi:hypothetical protein
MRRDLGINNNMNETKKKNIIASAAIQGRKEN